MCVIKNYFLCYTVQIKSRLEQNYHNVNVVQYKSVHIVYTIDLDEQLFVSAFYSESSRIQSERFTSRHPPSIHRWWLEDGSRRWLSMMALDDGSILDAEPLTDEASHDVRRSFVELVQSLPWRAHLISHQAVQQRHTTHRTCKQHFVCNQHEYKVEASTCSLL